MPFWATGLFYLLLELVVLIYSRLPGPNAYYRWCLSKNYTSTFWWKKKSIINVKYELGVVKNREIVTIVFICTKEQQKPLLDPDCSIRHRTNLVKIGVKKCFKKFVP